MNEQIGNNPKIKSFEDADELLCDLYGIEETDDSHLENDDGTTFLPVKNIRILVDNYLKRSGKPLETTVEEGGPNDMYFALDMLKMSGQESNFTLIATMTTMYYIELKNNYKKSFPDETSLLAMAGILDASVNIFACKQITVDQVIEIANNSHEPNRYLNFILSLAPLVVSVDTPDLELGDVEDVCLKETESIKHAIQKTFQTYKSEPMLSRATQAIMTAPDFAYVRKAVGVHD